MKTVVLECEYCYIESIIRFDSEMHEAPKYCPHCGRLQDDDYEELEFE